MACRSLHSVSEEAEDLGESRYKQRGNMIGLENIDGLARLM